MPLVEQDDLVVAKRAGPIASLVLRAIASNLIPRLGDGGRAVHAEHRPRALLQRETGDHAGLRRAGDRADDDRVEEDLVPLLLRDFLRPAREAEPAQRMVGCTGRNGVRRASISSTDCSASSQLRRIPMSKPAGSSRTSAPMIRESRMLPTVS